MKAGRDGRRAPRPPATGRLTVYPAGGRLGRPPVEGAAFQITPPAGRGLAALRLLPSAAVALAGDGLNVAVLDTRPSALHKIRPSQVSRRSRQGAVFSGRPQAVPTPPRPLVRRSPSTPETNL